MSSLCSLHGVRTVALLFLDGTGMTFLSTPARVPFSLRSALRKKFVEGSFLPRKVATNCRDTNSKRPAHDRRRSLDILATCAMLNFESGSLQKSMPETFRFSRNLICSAVYGTKPSFGLLPTFTP